jgi:hypothetical protein
LIALEKLNKMNNKQDKSINIVRFIDYVHNKEQARIEIARSTAYEYDNRMNCPHKQRPYYESNHSSNNCLLGRDLMHKVPMFKQTLKMALEAVENLTANVTEQHAQIIATNMQDKAMQTEEVNQQNKINGFKK